MSPVEKRLVGLRRLKVVTDRQCEILVLRKAHNLSIAQVALALDISPSTVHSTTKRALQKIEIHYRKEAA